MTDEKQLWEQFQPGASSPSPGAGILYCLKYELPRIEAHHKSVVDALKELGVCIVEEGEKLGLRFCSEYSTNGDQSNLLGRVNALVEELACLNEALEYSRGGLGDCRTIDDLKNRLMVSYFDMLTRGSQVNAYELVEFIIPSMVGDLNWAHGQNRVLSCRDRKSLEELSMFAKRKADHMNNPHGYAVFG